MGGGGGKVFGRTIFRSLFYAMYFFLVSLSYDLHIYYVVVFSRPHGKTWKLSEV